MKKSTKILIFQHNPMSYKSANGRTLAMFFSGTEAENLAQIYVSDMETDFSLCAHFFRISETAMLKNACQNGHPISQRQIFAETKVAAPTLTASAKKIPYFVKDYMTLVRDGVWRKNRWDTPELNAWIQEFSPDCMFFSAGNIAAEYEMVITLCKRYRIPLVMHIGDDYFTKKKYFPISMAAYQCRMQKCFAAAYEASGCIVAIGEAMKRATIARFGEKPYVVAMNAVSAQTHYRPYEHREPFQISYIGNLGINRIDTIFCLCEALECLNRERERFHLNLYTRSQFSNKILAQIHSYSCCTLHGAIDKEVVERVMEKSGILLHVESFKKRWKTILETAISTKTPELLISGRPILVIGPRYSSTVEFLESTETAIVIHTEDAKQIAQSIENGLSDQQQCQNRIEHAREIAVEYFSVEKTLERIQYAIQTAVGEMP